MKKVLMSMFLVSVFVVSAMSQSYSFDKYFTASINKETGEIDAVVPLTDDQLIGSPNKRHLDGERIPKNAKIEIWFFYNDQVGKADGVRIPAIVDWDKKEARASFPVKNYDFADTLILIRSVPKVPGYNKAKGESVWLNPPDPSYIQQEGGGGYNAWYSKKANMLYRPAKK